MKFPRSPVHTFNDVTRNFDWLKNNGAFANGIRTAYNVASWVKAGNLNTTDQSTPLGKLATAIGATTYGGRISIPAAVGPIRVDEGFAIPINRSIIVEGEGSGWRSAGGHGSILQRRVNPSAGALTAEAGAMIYCLGTDSADSERAVGGVTRLMLDGGSDTGVTSGVGLFIRRGQGTPINDVYLRNFPGTAFLVNQVFNASWYDLKITESGNGTTDPAFVIGGAGTPGNLDGTITLNIFGLRCESNLGTDLKITGNSSGTGHPSTEINVIGSKMEGTAGAGTAAPYHHIDFGELVNVIGGGIFCHRSSPPILIDSLVTGDGEDRLIQYRGFWIEQATGVTAPNYFIDVKGGSLDFQGTLRGDPVVADVRIRAGVRAGAVSVDAKCFTKVAGGGRRPLTIDDQRAAPEF